VKKFLTSKWQKEFDENGYKKKRFASIIDLAINETERKLI
jgi:nuclear transport factor 2 (NTF2) superfamily protein